MPVTTDAEIEISAFTWVPPFEGRFSAGDLMMTSVLRILRHTDLVSRLPNLHQYQARCEARPAFSRALEAQLAVFSIHQPAEAQ